MTRKKSVSQKFNDMTTEEKAMAYAKAKIESFGCNGVPSSTKDIRQMIAEGYVAGATEVLKSPWKSTKDEIPDGNVKVLYLLRDGRLNIGYFVNDDYQRYWMPIPAPPTK